jgi:diacylglycerol kinase family enzyme
MSKKPVTPNQLSCIVVINRRSGTVRTRGAEAVRDLVETALGDSFKPFKIILADGDVLPDIEKALQAGSAEVIIAGGGDGTISSAAELVLRHKAILGALPLGTMNLFVRALGFSPVLEEAVQQLKTAEVRSVDVGVANNKIFLHQVSFGVQPRLARLRERMGYRSRFTKMLSGARAFFMLAMAPRPVRVNILVGNKHVRVTSPMIAISNNKLGAKHDVSLPEKLDEGILGIYMLNDISLRTLMRLARNYMLRRPMSDSAIDEHSGMSVTIKRRPRRFSQVKKKRKALLSSIDGEVVLLKNPVHIEIRPKALRVLAARPETETNTENEKAS